MRSTLCNILAASSDQRDECGQPVTSHFEGIGVVLGVYLTRMIFTTKWAAPKVSFLIKFRQRNDAALSHIDVRSKIF